MILTFELWEFWDFFLRVADMILKWWYTMAWCLYFSIVTYVAEGYNKRTIKPFNSRGSELNYHCLNSSSHLTVHYESQFYIFCCVALCRNFNVPELQLLLSLISRGHFTLWSLLIVLDSSQDVLLGKTVIPSALWPPVSDSKPLAKQRDREH